MAGVLDAQLLVVVWRSRYPPSWHDLAGACTASPVVCCRSASALEEAARTHKQRTGRPFVLIIDAVDRLAEHAPDILETLQERHCSSCSLLHIMQCICDFEP